MADTPRMDDQKEPDPNELKHELDLVHADLAQIRENTYQLIGAMGLTNCILYEIRDSLKAPNHPDGKPDAQPIQETIWRIYAGESINNHYLEQIRDCLMEPDDVDEDGGEIPGSNALEELQYIEKLLKR